MDEEGGPPTPAGSFSGRSSLGRDGAHTPATSLGQNHRASPPLEGDEKEFTQTASSMQKRKFSEEASVQSEDVVLSVEASHENIENGEVRITMATAEEAESEESSEQRNSEAAAALLGYANHRTMIGLSSPVVRPMTAGRLAEQKLPVDNFSLGLKAAAFGSVDVAIIGSDESNPYGSWADMKSPENVELEELDDLLSGDW
jgi:hypothetical protein